MFGNQPRHGKDLGDGASTGRVDLARFIVLGAFSRLNDAIGVVDASV